MTPMREEEIYKKDARENTNTVDYEILTCHGTPFETRIHTTIDC